MCNPYCRGSYPRRVWIVRIRIKVIDELSLGERLEGGHDELRRDRIQDGVGHVGVRERRAERHEHTRDERVEDERRDKELDPHVVCLVNRKYPGRRGPFYRPASQGI